MFSYLSLQTFDIRDGDEATFTFMQAITDKLMCVILFRCWVIHFVLELLHTPPIKLNETYPSSTQGFKIQFRFHNYGTECIIYTERRLHKGAGAIFVHCVFTLTSSSAGSMIFNKRHMYSHSEMSESTGIETKH